MHMIIGSQTAIQFETHNYSVIRSRKSKDRQYNDQKCEDTKEVIRRRKYKDRQYGDQKCEDTKGVIRRRKYKNRQYGDH